MSLSRCMGLSAVCQGRQSGRCVTHSAGLGGWEAMSVKPLFQIGFCYGQVPCTSCGSLRSRGESRSGLLTSPGLVEPVARIRRSLSDLLSNSIIVAAGLGQYGVPLAGLRYCILLDCGYSSARGQGNRCGLTRNGMMITKGLELALRPGVQDPVLDVEISVLSLVLGLVPRSCNLCDQSVLA